MAKAKGITLELLKSAISDLVTSNKIAQDFTATYNLAGLLNTIGKIYTVDQMFVDKLAKFDGEFLPYGKTVEEWAIDLVGATPVSSVEDVEAITSAYPNYRPTKFSYELGKQIFKITRAYDDLNKGVHNEEQLTELVMGIMRALANSVILYRYGAKKQLVGRLADACVGAMSDTDATLWAKGTSQSTIGARFKNASTGTKWAILQKAYDSTADLTFDQAVSAGYLTVLNVVETVAKPVDATTGENFLIAVKNDIEKASDASTGNSLSGNTLGVTGGMTLIIKQGIKAPLEVKTEAGAFNAEKLAVPAEIISVPDFGAMTNDDVYAVLIDDRAIRLFPTSDANFQQENGAVGFMNYFRHWNATCHYSLNAFVKVYKDVED